MNGLTIIETAQFEQIKKDIEELKEFVNKSVKDLQKSKKIYYTELEAAELTGMCRQTLWKNRDQIGYSRPAGIIRYKLDDLLEFMNQSYHKNN